MAETWRVVLASGEVRSYTTERVDYPGEPSLWRARGEGWRAPGAYALTERAAVCAAASTVPASDLVEILATNELTRAELRAQAFREGAEAMRAASMAACGRIAEQASTVAKCSAGPAAATRFTGMHHGAELCANTIDALPVPPCPEVSR